jgi:hypothetical protein
MCPLLETLESRQLLSANPLGVKAPPETIAADQAAITAAQATLTADKASWAATLKIDKADVPVVVVEQNALVRSARKAVADARGNPVAVQTAKGNLLIAQANAKTAVAEAKNQVKLDQGVSNIAIAADKKAITQAKLKVREDRIAK